MARRSAEVPADGPDGALPERPHGAECCAGQTPERRERRDAAEHRRRILETARALFAEQGVEQTSMAQIGRACGVGQGTLYRRYTHKGDLCAALLAENTRSLIGQIEAQIAADRTPALELLAELLERMAVFTEANAPLLGAIGDAACGSRRDSAFTNPLYTWLRATALALLERAGARGETGPLDAEATVDALLAPLTIDLFLYQRLTLGLPRERILEARRHLLFEGLRARET